MNTASATATSWFPLFEFQEPSAYQLVEATPLGPQLFARYACSPEDALTRAIYLFVAARVVPTLEHLTADIDVRLHLAPLHLAIGWIVHGTRLISRIHASDVVEHQLGKLIIREGQFRSTGRGTFGARRLLGPRLGRRKSGAPLDVLDLSEPLRVLEHFGVERVLYERLADYPDQVLGHPPTVVPDPFAADEMM